METSNHNDSSRVSCSNHSASQPSSEQKNNPTMSVVPQESQIVVAQQDFFRLPPPKPTVTVLEEDEHIENISEIIQRDFFPDIPKVSGYLYCFCFSSLWSGFMLLCMVFLT
eukprot:Sdes_comp20727_c0_seq3m16526